MCRLRRVLVALVVALAFAFGSTPVLDASKGPKTVKVKEYKRKDGTRVQSHKRSAPRSSGSSYKAPKASKPKKSRSSVSPVYYPTYEPTQTRERSYAAKAAFMRQTGYPNGRPGYVVDHVIPLACGGADAPYNMQWQTTADAKAKDKTERRNCH